MLDRRDEDTLVRMLERALKQVLNRMRGLGNRMNEFVRARVLVKSELLTGFE